MAILGGPAGPPEKSKFQVFSLGADFGPFWPPRADFGVLRGTPKIRSGGGLLKMALFLGPPGDPRNRPISAKLPKLPKMAPQGRFWRFRGVSRTPQNRPWSPKIAKIGPQADFGDFRGPERPILRPENHLFRPYMALYSLYKAILTRFILIYLENNCKRGSNWLTRPPIT